MKTKTGGEKKTTQRLFLLQSIWFYYSLMLIVEQDLNYIWLKQEASSVFPVLWLYSLSLPVHRLLSLFLFLSLSLTHSPSIHCQILNSPLFPTTWRRDISHSSQAAGTGGSEDCNRQPGKARHKGSDRSQSSRIIILLWSYTPSISFSHFQVYFLRSMFHDDCLRLI